MLSGWFFISGFESVELVLIEREVFVRLLHYQEVQVLNVRVNFDTLWDMYRIGFHHLHNLLP